MLIFHEGPYYDLATVMFFALSLALLARGKHLAYLLLFPVAILNRETTFLLTLVFIVSSFYRYQRTIPRHIFYSVVYHVLIWILIRAVTIIVIADNPGALFLWRSLLNLSIYASMPLQSFFFLFGFALFVYGALFRWNEKPAFLRMSFLV